MAGATEQEELVSVSSWPKGTLCRPQPKQQTPTYPAGSGTERKQGGDLLEKHEMKALSAKVSQKDFPTVRAARAAVHPVPATRG